MKNLLRLLLKSQHQKNRSKRAQTDKGMTLVELLVGAIMAFLIITPMLGFVVDMLNTDRREQVKSNTEQDLQAAVDFIAQDLSQAIYIYDNDGITALKNSNSLRPPTTDPAGTPILVFWKRQLQPKALPVLPTAANTPNPANCNTTDKPCNDAYVLSLVAYYQINENNPASIWCQPSGANCPTRIVRYQIRDGLKDPKAASPATNPYYASVKTGQERSPAYNRLFDLSKPLENVTEPNVNWESGEVLVNYLDYGKEPKLIGNECRTALGNPTTQTGATTSPITEDTLKVTDRTTKEINSFYACVDTERNVARVTIRGNSLRRIQTDADYNEKKSAYFPTASVQVQGLGSLGK
ncbi:hormogonium polysaccharide secretion pseudopilin HpsC [Microcoleus sp. BR0-C5]|uniref:hormogonium polysaccharide secretion pseudopilin HpsC n=1 Tax=Microcoleus sp. BR0-C5 TaxID=2818713 RepID=UPI002FD6925B